MILVMAWVVWLIRLTWLAWIYRVVRLIRVVWICLRYNNYIDRIIGTGRNQESVKKFV